MVPAVRIKSVLFLFLSVIWQLVFISDNTSECWIYCFLKMTNQAGWSSGNTRLVLVGFSVWILAEVQSIVAFVVSSVPPGKC